MISLVPSAVARPAHGLGAGGMQSGVTPQDCEHEIFINHRSRNGLQAATETIASLTFGQCSRIKYAFSIHWLFLAHFGQSGFRSSHLFDFSSYPMKASSRLQVPITKSRGKTMSVRKAAHNGGIDICQGCDITFHVLLRISFQTPTTILDEHASM